MNRVYNFSAGPSMLPLPVLEKAAAEMICYGDSGMSVMEMSHRSPDYEAIIADAESMLRRLMNIPDNYKVLFLQGGASTQFAAVPMNLIRRTGKADYIVSGQFSGKAYKEAEKLGYDVRCVATS
ncbi:MAG: aminotransferase class V-fold PLP-dependent enzyme, partial [Clostridia bacterium]|nr:aminotransferase class V-fold PLP-dependent enzyme [Clostridia bacterium]